MHPHPTATLSPPPLPFTLPLRFRPALNTCLLRRSLPALRLGGGLSAAGIQASRVASAQTPPIRPSSRAALRDEEAPPAGAEAPCLARPSTPCTSVERCSPSRHLNPLAFPSHHLRPLTHLPPATLISTCLPLSRHPHTPSTTSTPLRTPLSHPSMHLRASVPQFPHPPHPCAYPSHLHILLPEHLSPPIHQPPHTARTTSTPLHSPPATQRHSTLPPQVARGRYAPQNAQLLLSHEKVQGEMLFFFTCQQEITLPHHRPNTSPNRLPAKRAHPSTPSLSPFNNHSNLPRSPLPPAWPSNQ